METNPTAASNAIAIEEKIIKRENEPEIYAPATPKTRIKVELISRLLKS